MLHTKDENLLRT